jgi:hypothetical protein
MRLIQFNSGLRVVLKDVQQQQTENTPRYYLATPVHHSSNSSLATTSSSIKSNGSIGTNHEYYINRQYLPSTNYRVKTPPVLNTTGSLTIVVEVGRITSIKKQHVRYFESVQIYVCVIFIHKISTCIND